MDDENQPRQHTALSTGVVQLEPGRQRYTLSTGRVADVRPGKGKDLRLASRMVADTSGSTPDPVLYEFALIAIKARLDGRELTLEDIDELSDVEAGELLGICRGKVQSDAEKEAAAAVAKAPSPPST